MPGEAERIRFPRHPSIGMKRILLVLAVLSCGPVSASAGNPFLRAEKEAPFVVAHGGCKHLFPENTMVAFDGAVALGVDMLEMDVRLTADSVLVTHHDDTLQRTSDGEGPLIGYTLEELGRFNFGAKFAGLEKNYPYRDRKVAVTTLEEVLSKYGAVKRMFIEIKGEGQEGLRCAEKLAALLRRTAMEERVLVSAFDDRIIRHFRRASQGRVQTAMGRRHIRRFVMMSKLGLGFLWCGKHRSMLLPLRSGKTRLDRPSIVRTARRKGISVYYWTVNKTEEMRHLGALGVDGVITDRPDRLPGEWVRTSSD